MIAFVGKEAYRGPFRERPEHGLQARRLAETALFVLPSTSPANAAVPWEERLRCFRALHALMDMGVTDEIAAGSIDARGKELLVAKKRSESG